MRKRNINIMFRLNETELEILKENVKKFGLSQENFIRQIINGAVLKEKPNQQFYAVMSELSGIGNRINQLAAKANSLNFSDAPILNEEAVKWAKFQTLVQKTFLSPEKKC